jgi:hypothetical protein
VLRAPEARDRAAFIELLASPEVGTYVAWDAEQWFGMRSPVTPSD